MVAVDTNVLVRYITDDHPTLSPRARKILQAAKPGWLLLDRLVMEELGYVLHSSYGFAKPQIGLVYNSLLAEERFFIADRELAVMAVSFFQTYHALSFEDCWLLALVRAGKAESLVTFDAGLKKYLKR